MGNPVKEKKPEVINFGEEDQMEVYGYMRNTPKMILTWTAILLSCGLLRIVFHWWPQLMLYCTHTKCSLDKAQSVLMLETYGKNNYKRYHVKPILILNKKSSNGKPKEQDTFLLKEKECQDEFVTVRYFMCKKLRYLWDSKLMMFKKLQGLEDMTAQEMYDLKGLSRSDQLKRRALYGINEIRVEVTSIVKLLFLEVLNPFYVFQVFSVGLWFYDEYTYYAIAIVIMSVAGITSTVYQTRQNQSRLRRTVQSSDIIEVHRGNGVYEMIPTEYLVPGDIIVIPPQGFIVNCDAVLLSGNCIVNESMLTGESIPVTKVPMPQDDTRYNSREHGRHTLYCGTKVIQTRFYGQERVHAAVIRTGFLTTKGNLVRSILYPPPVDFKFEKDSYKFVGFMACIASLGFLASVWWKVRAGETAKSIIVKSLDLITIVIPPALPAAMTVGRIYALRRLQRKGIYCTSPRTVTVTGSIDCVCFDKTGTLTEEGLDLRAVIPVTKEFVFSEALTETHPDIDNNEMFLTLEAGMSTCHSLTKIDGDLVGDPLDLKMLEWTGWRFEEPEIADNEKFDQIIPAIVSRPSNIHTTLNQRQVGIIRQFPFSSSLQRMAVITRTLHEEEFELFCKGSPEKITSLCDPSTVPGSFLSTLAEYTNQGYRVIAMAHRRLPEMSYTKVQKVPREEIEHSLTFLGLIVLENRLKPESASEIRILQQANIRTIMVTGDNLQTSTSVAIECGLVSPSDHIYILNCEDPTEPSKVRLNVEDYNQVVATVDYKNGYMSIPIQPKSHIALTGKTFHVVSTQYPHLLPTLLANGTIFARMSPDQKQHLVEGLQSAGYFVGMCGDGANDCGALKAAHAGVSLSEAEASVASPFTYNRNNISCISTVIQEGRTALVTSFGIFKYMVIYSFTQFLSMLILYAVYTNISDVQFLYIDLFLISLFALFFGYTEPQPTLVPNPPPFSLISFRPLLSIVLHTALVFAFQIASLFLVQSQSWFFAMELNEDNKAVESYENYSVFTVSVFQYIVMVVVYSQGKPYRKPIWTNWRLCGSVVIMTAFTIYLVLIPCSWLTKAFRFLLPETFSFQLLLLGLVAIYAISAIVVEEIIINHAAKFKESQYHRNDKSRDQFEIKDFIHSLSQ